MQTLQTEQQQTENFTVCEDVLTIKEFLQLIGIYKEYDTDSPKNLLELRDYLDHNDNENINDLWDYPLDEIDHIVENDLHVALVKDSLNNFRWFEFC